MTRLRPWRWRKLAQSIGVALTCLFCSLVATARLVAAEADGEPLLRLEAGGPTSYVTALAFSPDGKTLYAGSWDKTVRVWRLDAQGKYRLDAAAWRVPIGPGLDGAINAIAVSPDGRWLAAAGKAIVQGAADFRNPGRVLPSVGGMSEEMRLDEGTIYVFDTNNRTTYTLRGHNGEVRALAFAPSTADEPILLSAARQWQSKSPNFIGAVQLWSVLAKDPRVASRALPELKHETWPKLAVQRTGANRSALKVGIAWGDGVFRIWDVAQARVEEVSKQGQFLDTVVFNEAASEFITGAVGDDGGTRLRSWRPVTNAAPELDVARSLELAKTGDTIVAPRGLAMGALRAGGKIDTLFTVIHRHSLREAARDQYELWLLPPTRGAKIQPFRLWDTGPPPRRVPVIATSPTGRHVAITRGAEIYVYAIDSLVAGRNEPSILRSAGTVIHGVAFARQGHAADAPLGLALAERDVNSSGGLKRFEPGDLIFDLTASKLQDFRADAAWRPAPSATGDWRIQVQSTVGNAAPVPKTQLVIQQGNERRGTIELEAEHVLTSHAMCANAKLPVVAVASHHHGLPSLELYSAQTGRLIRRLSAHAALISSVAFSDDGLLLASAADDQTVCLWRMADLGRIVGQHGMADGVAVVATADGLVVQSSGQAGPLAEGYKIQGRVLGDKLQPWPTPQAFYDTFWNALPGEIIKVRGAAPGGAVRDVAITVAQGADERKPILSLFVTRALAGQPRGWIGWNPMGPYQSSAADVEQYLGWHFNTGRPEAPVAFALADQYREKYYREGLIESLITTGLPPKNKQADAPLPAPLLDLVLDGGEAINFGNTILLRAAPAKASLIVAGLPIDRVAGVELQVGDKPSLAFKRLADGETWSVALDPADWKRGEHRLKAIVHTREATPQHFAIERVVRYQAPAPRIKLTHRKLPGGTMVDAATFTFSADVEPGVAGETVQVTLQHLHGQEKQVLQTWTTDKPLKIENKVALVEGGNVLELITRNRDALAGFEASEITVDRVTLNYSPRMELPNLVDLKLLPLADGQPVPALDEQAPAIVTIDKIQLAGEITGGDGKLEIESSLGGAASKIAVSPAPAGKPAKFNAKDIALKPGVQTIRIRRQDGVGPVIETEARIDYRPPLPKLIVESPKTNQVLLAGRDEPTIPLVAKLTAVSHRHPFVAVLLVNNKPSLVVPKVDIEAGTLSAEVPLEPGDNEIAIRLSNEWNPSSDQPVASIKYLSLPTVDKFNELGKITSPVVDVVVSGKSAIPITVVEVSGELLPSVRLSGSAVAFDKAANTWQATLKNIPLLRDPHDIAVQVWNEHGPAQMPGKLTLPAWRQAELPPLIELVSGGNVTSAGYELRFTVRSKSALRSIKVLHNQGVVEYAPKLDDIQPDAAGWSTLVAKVPIQLAPGDNRLAVTAANDGGAQTELSLVNYIDPPARVVIERLETVDLPKRVIPIVMQDNRARAAQASPVAKVLVCGRLEWPRSIDQTYLRRLKRLQVWVNGFQQAPVDISPPAPGSLTSEFSAFVVLNQHKDNRLQIALPDLTPDIATLFDAYVDCDAPVSEQRLHLLVIGVGASPGAQAQLEGEVLSALKARKTERGLRTAAFDRVALYGPIVGADITPQQVRAQLAIIKVKIDELYKTNKSSVRPANDVVMIYLQGGTLAESQGDFYITTRPISDPRTERALREREPRILMDVALRSRTLVDFLTYTTGAHLLMLDVAGTLQVEQAAQWPSHSHAAMLRYTWLKDSVAPAKARLLAALPEAMEASGELRQLDANIAKIHVRLAGEYPLSVAYKPQVPESLEDLLLGETLPKNP